MDIKEFIDATTDIMATNALCYMDSFATKQSNINIIKNSNIAYEKYNFYRLPYIINLAHLFFTYLIFITVRKKMIKKKVLNKYSILYGNKMLFNNGDLKHIVNLSRHAIFINNKTYKIARRIVKKFEDENK